MNRDQAQPAPLRDAATVVLIRDGEAGIEVFLQRRVKQMAFAGGMTVFPGGGVDERDKQPHVRWTGPGIDWWAGRLGTDEAIAQALVCAAVRETFEECGVLLAGSADEVYPDPSVFAAERAALVAKEIAFVDFLERHDLTLRADLLQPMAHWITPVNEPRRYDTRFFLAALPVGHEADAETSEAAGVAWMTPEQALAAWDAGEHFLLPPTWTQLRDLAAFPTVAAAIAAPRTIVPIEPEVAAGDAASMLGLRFDHAPDYFAGLDDERVEQLRNAGR